MKEIIQCLLAFLGVSTAVILDTGRLHVVPLGADGCASFQADGPLKQGIWAFVAFPVDDIFDAVGNWTVTDALAYLPYATSIQTQVGSRQWYNATQFTSIDCGQITEGSNDCGSVYYRVRSLANLFEVMREENVTVKICASSTTTISDLKMGLIQSHFLNTSDAYDVASGDVLVLSHKYNSGVFPAAPKPVNVTYVTVGVSSLDLRNSIIESSWTEGIIPSVSECNTTFTECYHRGAIGSRDSEDSPAYEFYLLYNRGSAAKVSSQALLLTVPEIGVSESTFQTVGSGVRVELQYFVQPIPPTSSQCSIEKLETSTGALQRVWESKYFPRLSTRSSDPFPWVDSVSDGDDHTFSLRNDTLFLLFAFRTKDASTAALTWRKPFEIHGNLTLNCSLFEPYVNYSVMLKREGQIGMQTVLRLNSMVLNVTFDGNSDRFPWVFAVQAVGPSRFNTSFSGQALITDSHNENTAMLNFVSSTVCLSYPPLTSECMLEGRQMDNLTVDHVYSSPLLFQVTLLPFNGTSNYLLLRAAAARSQHLSIGVSYIIPHLSFLPFHSDESHLLASLTISTSHSIEISYPSGSITRVHQTYGTTKIGPICDKVKFHLWNENPLDVELKVLTIDNYVLLLNQSNTFTENDVRILPPGTSHVELAWLSGLASHLVLYEKCDDALGGLTSKAWRTYSLFNAGFDRQLLDLKVALQEPMFIRLLPTWGSVQGVPIQLTSYQITPLNNSASNCPANCTMPWCHCTAFNYQCFNGFEGTGATLCRILKSHDSVNHNSSLDVRVSNSPTSGSIYNPFEATLITASLDPAEVLNISASYLPGVFVFVNFGSPSPIVEDGVPLEKLTICNPSETKPAIDSHFIQYTVKRYMDSSSFTILSRTAKSPDWMMDAQMNFQQTGIYSLCTSTNPRIDFGVCNTNVVPIMNSELIVGNLKMVARDQGETNPQTYVQATGVLNASAGYLHSLSYTGSLGQRSLGVLRENLWPPGIFPGPLKAERVKGSILVTLEIPWPNDGVQYKGFLNYYWSDVISIAQINSNCAQETSAITPYSKAVDTTSSVYVEQINLGENALWFVGVSLQLVEPYAVNATWAAVAVDLSPNHTPPSPDKTNSLWYFLLPGAIVVLAVGVGVAVYIRHKRKHGYIDIDVTKAASAGFF